MKELLEYQNKIANLQYTINLLTWDLNVSTPKNAQNDLINLISDYQNQLFQLQTSDVYGELLHNAISSAEYANLEECEKRYINNLLRHYENGKKVPALFFGKYSKMKNKANVIWKEAKKTGNYEMYKPYLYQIIELTKEYYRYLYPDAKNIYDMMLNEYETGVTSELIDRLFSELKSGIADLIPKENIDVKVPNINYSEQQLMECAKYLLNYIGFDFTRGMVGICSNSFTDKMNANDIRIAFRYTTNPISFVKTIIHEGGHGIFEQNISPKLSKYENVTIDNLYALHESQSRFYENMLGRNINFWIPIYDDVKRILNLDYSLEEFVKLLNTPKYTPIRIDADELTYCMHIILRYEIERDIFDNDVDLADLPEIWRQKTKEYLNIDIKDDREGILQDVHWSGGQFGYFPSYIVGSIYSGMFYKFIESQLGDINELLRNGEIKKITQFLIDNIYTNGGAYTSLEILSKITNEEITASPLIDYFNSKYNQKEGKLMNLKK